MTDLDLPPEVLAAWRGLRVSPARFGTGLINATHEGELRGVRVLLQRLHPVFAGTVNVDLDAVTRHLERAGMRTPRLVPTDGARSATSSSRVTPPLRAPRGRGDFRAESAPPESLRCASRAAAAGAPPNRSSCARTLIACS